MYASIQIRAPLTSRGDVHSSLIGLVVRPKSTLNCQIVGNLQVIVIARRKIHVVYFISFKRHRVLSAIVLLQEPKTLKYGQSAMSFPWQNSEVTRAICHVACKITSYISLHCINSPALYWQKKQRGSKNWQIIT